MAKVYVSSTFDDLKECRKKVSAALRRMEHEDLAMEHDVAEDARPVDTCVDDVRQADVYLGIFAFRYGFRPPGFEQSITELEYRAAREAGKECLILLLSKDAAWPLTRLELDAMDRIEALRSELEQEHRVSYFTGEDDIEARVGEVIHKWEKRHGLQHGPVGGWERYRAAVVKRHQWVRLTVIAGAQPDRIARIPLADVFIPQLAVARLPVMDLPAEVLKYKEKLFEARCDAGEVRERWRQGDDLNGLASAEGSLADDLPEISLELLGRERTQVILGTPGSGKSTLLECAALLLCEPIGTREPVFSLGSLAEPPVPLLIDLRQLALRSENAFLEYLATIVGERYGTPLDAAALERQLRDKPTLLLFDGLDEVFDSGDRTWIVRQVAALAEQFPRASCVVTSRIVGYDRSELFLAGFTHYTLIEFNAQQIERFVRCWYEHYTWEGDERDADALIRRITESPRLKELAGNPLLLTMMAVLFKHQDLPEQRWKLYERCTDVLLEDWDVKRKDIDLKTLLPLDITVRAPQKAQILQRVSMFMLEHSDDRSELNAIAAQPLMDILAAYLEENYAKPPGEAAAIAQGILNHLRERTYILAEIGAKIFGFVHRTFMEYFAASLCKAEFNQRRADYEWLRGLFRENWDREQWQEVLLLLTGILADQSTPIPDIIDDLRQLELTGPPLNLAFGARCVAEAGQLDEEEKAAATLIVANLVDEIAAHATKTGSGSERFVEVGLTAFTHAAPHVVIPARSLAVIETLRSAPKAQPRIVGWQMAFANAAPAERMEFALAGLADGNEVIRRAAIAALEREWPGRPDACDALVGVVRADKRVRVRQAALDALQRSWPAPPAILDAIAERAPRESAYTYVMSVMSYLERSWKRDPRGSQLIIQVARAFIARSRSRRREPERLRVAAFAVECLGRGWGDAPELTLRVLAWIGGTPGEVRRSVVLGVGSAWRTRPAMLDALLDIARSADMTAEARATAIDLLGVGWPQITRATHAIGVAARQDSDPVVRARALMAISGVSGVPRMVGAMLHAICGSDLAACELLRPVPTRPVPDAGIDLIRSVFRSDSDPLVRAVAAFALAASAGNPRARAAMLLDHELVVAESNERVRAAAAALLISNWFGDAYEDLDDAADTLSAAVSDPDPRLAVVAFRALTTFPPPRRWEVGRRIETDYSQATSVRIRRAVAGGWPATPTAVLMRLLHDDPDTLVRATAAASIAMSLSHVHHHDSRWAALADGALGDPDPLVRGSILSAWSGLFIGDLPSPWPELLRDVAAEAVSAYLASPASRGARVRRATFGLEVDRWASDHEVERIRSIVRDRIADDPDARVRTLGAFVRKHAPWMRA